MIPHNRWTNHRSYEIAAISALRSGHVASGGIVAALEHDLARAFRPGGDAVCVSSGTAALSLALGLLKRRGQDVLVPTLSCAALAQACEMEGLRWIPVDEGESSDVAVHTYGMVNPLADGALVEDFTHAPGAKGVGGMGQLAVISFGATKPLGVGSGGAVIGDGASIEAIRARLNYDEVAPAFQRRRNLLWSDVPAAICRQRLARLGGDNATRRGIAARYCDAARHPSDCPHRWMEVPYRYILAVKDVPAALRYFKDAGVEAIQPTRPAEMLHRRVVMPAVQYPLAEARARTEISLPIWPDMTDEMVGRVARALTEMR